MRVLALVVVVAACGHKAADQSYADGVRALCDLPNHLPPPDQPYDTRLAGLETWANANITNPDAKAIGREGKADLEKAVAKAGIQKCLLLDYGMELQSFSDAMNVVCNATKPDPSYFKSHVLNAEVIRLMGAFGDMSPADRAARMRDAVARAGLTKCALLEARQADLDVPVVAGSGLADLDTSPTLVVTTTAIVIDGKSIVAVENGDVDPSEKEGGARGMKIPRLANFAAALGKALPTPPHGMTLVITPATPYRLLTEVVFSVHSATFRTFFLAVKTGTAIKTIPIELPDTSPKPAGLGLIVAVTKDKILVWSVSGQEGTLQKPKQELAIDHAAELAPVLAAIAAKHPDDHTIVVMADGAVTTQVVATVLAAARPAFSTINLGTGFE